MASLPSSAGLRSYASAMLAHWSTAMSGPLSVPLAIAAFYVQDQTAKVLLGLTAFACLWAASYRVWKVERDKVIALSPSLTIRVHDGPAYESGTRDADGGMLPDCWVFLARLTGTEKAVTRCQIILEDRNGQNHTASKLFDLRPGEQRDVPVLRFYRAKGRACRAFIYMSRADGEILPQAGGLILGPGRYRIKVLSAEEVPATLDVQLSKHPKVDDQWILEEIHPCPTTPKIVSIAFLKRWLPNPNLRKSLQKTIEH